MIPTGYVECVVLQGDCKFFDDYRYFYPSLGDTIILSEYQARIESDNGFVEIVEEEA